MVTLSPRFLSKRPRLAATIPLPIEDTTPPVTKIYFVMLTPYKIIQNNEKSRLITVFDNQNCPLPVYNMSAI
ncbi:hypothetical protein STH02_06390 [Streptococcus thermophilus]|nr:hypothetical protein STH02_06390 [Streptococcus thermophilus]